MKRVHSLYLETFGRAGTAATVTELGAMHRILAVMFVLASVPLLVAVNIVTLMFGVLVTFLGRDGVKFTFLRLWGRVRAIFVMLPLLAVFGIWHKLQSTGPFVLMSTMVITVTAALVIFLAIALTNRGRA